MKPYEIALREYGIHELVGPGSNPEVMKYYKEEDGAWVQDDSVPWCAAFVGWCLHRAGKPNSGLLNAKSYLTFGTETKDPVMGDLVVLWRDNVTSSNGHVGFFITRRNGTVWMLAGNQADEVDIAAYPESRVLDYRIIP